VGGGIDQAAKPLRLKLHLPYLRGVRL